MNKLYTKEDLEEAFEKGMLYEAGELELDQLNNGKKTAFEVWFETYKK